MASLIKRDGSFHLQWYVGSKIKRRSLRTSSPQIAKDLLRKFESARLRGIDNPLPTRTTIAQVLTRYVEHIRAHKTAKSAQTEIYYLREAFGPICEAVTITSRTPSPAARKKPAKPGLDRRHGEPIIEATYFEEVTTAQVADFITAKVRNRGLAPETANHYRQILVRLFNWAINESGIKLPIDKNPAAPVKKYRENAPEIRFLTLAQIDEQLAALADHPQLQTMVALYIYAGLRREEALWLTLDDIDSNIPPYGNIRVQAKTLRGNRWQPKTRVNRGVPISSDLRAWLDRYTPRPSVGSFYFPSPDGKHWDPDNFSQDLAAANAKAGLPWTCLDFRHTFGSQLAMRGESLYKISKLMGNSPDICRKHYAALMPDSLTGCVEFRRDNAGAVQPGQVLQVRNA